MPRAHPPGETLRHVDIDRHGDRLMPPGETSWVVGIDRAFVDRRLGPDVVNRSLAEARGYAEAPRLDAAGRLHARVTRAAAPSGMLAGRSEVQKVALRVQGGKDIELSCTCARGQFLCEHAMAVLVDLAIHPGLRDAVASQAPDEVRDARVAELERARTAALEERTIEERLARWMPPRGDDELEIDVEVVRTPGLKGPEERPALLLRVRRPHARGVVSPRELAASRLAPRYRRLLELAVPSTFHRDAFVATRAQASMLVHMLRESREGIRHAGKPLRYAKELVAPRVDVEGDRLVARWTTGGGDVVCEAADGLLFCGPFPYVWSEPHEVFHPVAPEVDLDVAWGIAAVPSLPLTTPALTERVGRALFARARGSGVALPPAAAFGLTLEAPVFVLRLSGSPLDVRAKLLVEGERGTELEASARRLVREAGFAREDDDEHDERELRAVDERAVDFWSRGIALVRASTEPRIDVEIAESLARTKIGPPVTASVTAAVETGWLETELDFSARMLKVEIAALSAALASGKRWVVLSDGTLSRITDDVMELVRDAEAAFGGERRARLPPHQLARVERWLARFGREPHPSLAELRGKLRARAVDEDPRLPAELAATLRPYQRHAVSWLQLLAEIGTGGVLADDMGLGKTLVTLTFLARWKEESGPAPSLVVCPTSVAGSWASEAARFTPSLRVLVLRGGDRTIELASADEHDVVVTTYGLLRRDVDALAARRFRAVVLDEAQNIKNAGSDTARAARRLDADMRIALSGTPVENRLGELWSIMSFANPGMLGTLAEFEERFERPIAMSPRGPAAEQLHALVRPFVLRRTKKEVLPELPAKTEVDRHCDLGAKQKRLYDALVLSLREAIKQDTERRGLARSRLSALTAILRLRQMACDPRLVDPGLGPDLSAKREVFLDLVRELVAEGRRALVFSQFVELFTLWREDLDREGITYEYLDGATTARDAVVARFQEGSAPLFLVSLKAGGAGLNLTAADTVIHLDPWWNPAVLDQATDRAHRMGQAQAVTVVRLVATGTIEEKILVLQEKKRELAAVVFGGDAGQGALAGLTEEDVRHLLDLAELAEPAGSGPLGDGAEDPVPAATPNLTSREIDDLRTIVRWLDETGIPKKELARKAGLPAAELALLLVGHRVRVPRKAAERIRALYDRRRAAFG